MTEENFLYLTYENSQIITRLKLFEYKQGSTQQIQLSVEKIGDIQLSQTYLSATVLYNGYSVIFSSKNIIELYKMPEEGMTMDFHRRLPLYIYRNNTEFRFNQDSSDPIFHITDNYLFIILGEPKYLYIYNLDTLAHDSLETRYKLDPKYEHTDNYILAENIEFTTAYYVIVFYGPNKFELIFFDSVNFLHSDFQGGNNLFLNTYEIQNSIYPEKTVDLKISPFYPEEYQNGQISPLKFSVDCSNKGLKIEPRQEEISTQFAN